MLRGRGRGVRSRLLTLPAYFLRGGVANQGRRLRTSQLTRRPNVREVTMSCFLLAILSGSWVTGKRHYLSAQPSRKCGWMSADVLVKLWNSRCKYPLHVTNWAIYLFNPPRNAQWLCAYAYRGFYFKHAVKYFLSGFSRSSGSQRMQSKPVRRNIKHRMIL